MICCNCCLPLHGAQIPMRRAAAHMSWDGDVMDPSRTKLDLSQASQKPSCMMSSSINIRVATRFGSWKLCAEQPGSDQELYLSMGFVCRSWCMIEEMNNSLTVQVGSKSPSSRISALWLYKLSRARSNMARCAGKASQVLPYRRGQPPELCPAPFAVTVVEIVWRSHDCSSNLASRHNQMLQIAAWQVSMNVK